MDTDLTVGAKKNGICPRSRGGLQRCLRSPEYAGAQRAGRRLPVRP